MFGWFENPRLRGGVHAEEHKSETAKLSIASGFPIPKKLYIPVQQHVGKPAEPVVKVGERILKGQLLAYSQGTISAPVHAPTSGVVADVKDFPAPHPSALPIRTVVIESDGQDEWAPLEVPDDPFELDAETICAMVGSAGVVGLGGAVFPSAVKLSLGRKSKIHTLLINAGECEPYLTCDDRLMQEKADEIVAGIRLMLRGMGAPKAMVGIEDNKPAAYQAMRDACRDYPNIVVSQVPTRYPMGWDRQMLRYLTGQEIPADGRAADIGVVVHNVATAHAVYKAICLGQPLISRVVTVSGAAVAQPRNVEVPIGTLMSEVLAFCDWDKTKMARLVMGGPMMGDALPIADVPVVKACNGILALTAAEIEEPEVQPCIRCSSCVTACPVGLLPLEMASRIKVNQLDAAVDLGLKDCISCGSCSYVCPSNIPLVHYFKFASGELVKRQQADHKSEQTKRLIDERNQRMERIRLEAEAEAQRAQEARAARLAAQQAQQAQQAQAKAEETV
ncbi:electron transport complex subunit RsxC [Methylomonas sp. UP202]|uniref:electron transport complex subunit RsxC n=1 Tax=Methylomonas sp. UP202 TaxID=3040943 RepID=UPI00143CB456|nr:electron transport complex subunit RsxC [Methylomonas sp. UP202]NJA07039.1 electron transport complex subunit RsxC [Methylococcaceae bacterium WWC4]WGS87174.1 electron transport complex subunit RsxC [Methylomonas sp. UP202]